MSAYVHTADSDIVESRNLLDQRGLAYLLLPSERVLPCQANVDLVTLATKDKGTVEHIVGFKVLD